MSDHHSFSRDRDLLFSQPLYVDLDGILIHTNLLWESLVLLLTRWPWLTPMPLIWMILGGKTRLKTQLVRLAPIDPALLPYNERVLPVLAKQKSLGRKLVLVTSFNLRLAEAIAGHLGCFDEVMASDEHHNLREHTRALRALLDTSDYLRNHQPGIVFPRALIETLRPHQWSKNLLVFVPIITANQLLDPAAWLMALWVAITFCVTASGIYVLNDLTDLVSDRAHPRKRRRPLASGSLPLVIGMSLAPLLLCVGLIMGASIGILPLISVYVAVSVAYTFWLKEWPLVDVFALSFLYLIRLYAGGLMTGHYVSMWLLGFSAFLFLALALTKRTVELADAETVARRVERRGYGMGDLTVLRMMGISSSFVASMLLALYVQSPEIAARYSSPTILWALVPLLLFWQTRMWLLSVRGSMHDDPIVFAAHDWVTWLILVLVLTTITVATQLKVGAR